MLVVYKKKNLEKKRKYVYLPNIEKKIIKTFFLSFFTLAISAQIDVSILLKKKN